MSLNDKMMAVFIHFVYDTNKSVTLGYAALLTLAIVSITVEFS